MAKPNNIDDYIAGFPKEIQKRLEQIRAAIKKAAPKAEEAISYGIPAFKLNGKGLIFFAAFKNHIGIYPAPRGSDAFKKELSVYKGGKGTVQFPFDKPLPMGLINKILKFRIKENLFKTISKKK